MSYRVANRIVFTEGGPQVGDTQLTTWESGDGLEFNLTQKQFMNSKLSSESRIKVTKDTNSSGAGRDHHRQAEAIHHPGRGHLSHPLPGETDRGRKQGREPRCLAGV